MNPKHPGDDCEFRSLLNWCLKTRFIDRGGPTVAPSSTTQSHSRAQYLAPLLGRMLFSCQSTVHFVFFSVTRAELHGLGNRSENRGRRRYSLA